MSNTSTKPPTIQGMKLTQSQFPTETDIKKFFEANPNPNPKNIENLKKYITNTYTYIKNHPDEFQGKVPDKKKQKQDLIKLINKKGKENSPQSAQMTLTNNLLSEQIKKLKPKPGLPGQPVSSSSSSLSSSSLSSSSSPSSSSPTPPPPGPPGPPGPLIPSGPPSSVLSQQQTQPKTSNTPSAAETPKTIPNPSLSPPSATGAKVTVTYQGKTSEFTVIPSATSSGGKRKSRKRKHHKKSHTCRHMRKKSHKQHH